MKILLTIITFSFTATSVYADDWRKTCDSYSELAETTMNGRQSGTPMAKMMKVLSNDEGSELFEKLIIAAYDSTRYSTERMQQRSIEEFRDEKYLECAKAMRAKK